MPLLNSCLNTLLLGLGIWEFSLRSLPRRYAHTFLKEVILKHPLKAWMGYLKYQRFLRRRDDPGDFTYAFENPTQDLARSLAEGEGLLIGMGYCQKPLPRASSPGCPAGRFNHTCLFLKGKGATEAALDPACQGCDIAAVGRKALAAGARMYIMTTAEDVARDLLISAIDQGRFSKVILFLCPYSAKVILLPLFICNLQGVLVRYKRGNCCDYPQFLSADRGVKREQTAITAEAWQRVMGILEHIARQRHREGLSPCWGFQREGNIYKPLGNTSTAKAG